MANEIVPPWETEEIPNSDLLFMRVHKNHIQNGKILLIAFRNHGDKNDPAVEPSMSTDWNKYSTPEECRQRAQMYGKDPAKYEVIQFSVEAVRDISGQRVEHTPIYEPHLSPPIYNRAHADVFGEKDEQARLSLRMIAHPALPFST